MCEIHQPIGNLRDNTFPEIWNSEAARKLRKSIKNKECHCTTEVFMWPSIVFNPLSLSKAMLGAKVWKTPAPLDAEELLPLELDQSGMPLSPDPATGTDKKTETPGLDLKTIQTSPD
jgi:hypothetical protein